jgi:DNA-binding protein HU-beta
MNKSELVSTISQRTGQSEKTVNEVLNGFIEVVGETVAKGKDKVTIPGFLSFERVARAARTGRNPRTGETMQVPASNAVKVTAGARLKAIAREGK